jgi:hypothetical protein
VAGLLGRLRTIDALVKSGAFVEDEASPDPSAA